MQSAEKLKILYGSSKILQNSNMIHLKDLDPIEFPENQVISTYDLSSVINARVEEIFTLLKNEYSKLKVDDLITKNLVLTGAGSKLNNLAETVGDIFSKVVKIGHEGGKKPTDSSAVATGMLKYLAKKQQDKLNLAGNIENKGKLSRLWAWFKENI